MRHDFMDKHRGRPFGLRALRMIGLIVGGVALAAAFALALAVVVQWLWNWLMPDIFSLKEITFWQAFGLVFLGRLLFGSLNHGHHGGKRFRRNNDRRHDSMCDGGDEERRAGRRPEPTPQ